MLFLPVLAGILISLITLLPLAWKWQLGVLRIGLLTTLLALLSGMISILLGNWLSIPLLLQAGLAWILTVVAVFAFLAYRFYRDPERTIPDTPNTIVSPADGKIIYIRKSSNGMLPVSTKHGKHYPLQELIKTAFYTEDVMVIGISMNFMDVHVNRAPIAGRIAFQRHFPGLFGSLRNPDMVFENERTTTIFEQGTLQIAVVQIASRLVRQIVSFVKEGQEVAQGQRFGIIRFGSQVDLVVPASPSIEIRVKPGELVRAGETVIATYLSDIQLVEPEDNKILDIGNIH